MDSKQISVGSLFQNMQSKVSLSEISDWFFALFNYSITDEMPNAGVSTLLQTLLQRAQQRSKWEQLVAMIQKDRPDIFGLAATSTHPASTATTNNNINQSGGQNIAFAGTIVHGSVTVNHNTIAPTQTQTQGQIIPDPTHRFLLISSMPSDQKYLAKLNDEQRIIKQIIENSPYAARIRLETLVAARITDVTAKMRTFKPTIIHFMGHGDKEDGFIFHSTQELKTSVHLNAEELQFLLEIDTPQILFMNSCFSDTYQLNNIPQNFVQIGTTNSIGDRTALTFATEFYNALIKDNASVIVAFKYAKLVAKVENLSPHYRLAGDDTIKLF